MASRPPASRVTDRNYHPELCLGIAVGTGRNSVEGQNVVRANLRRWAEELVDLTKRNRLLYFRHTASASLEFSQRAGEVEGGLRRSGWEFYFPDPPPDDPDEPYNPDPPRPGELVVQMLPKRYGPKIRQGLKNLAGRAQSEFLDSGLWVLYLGLGTLEWVDLDGKKARSPLLLVPVRLEKFGAERWRLMPSEDGEAAINPALAVKLERDHGIAIPTIDDLEETDPSTVITAIARLIDDDDWSTDDAAVLTSFTFQKEVIYRDLRANEDEIVEHEMVRLLAEGPSSDLALELDFTPDPEEELDTRHPPEDLACVRDADSTQRRCLIAARQGRSFVMDGPPGTGKSQTITNVIAQLLADGKTVLFVSEKAAALEVVQNRLAELSLDPFVLALHSHNATRKAVAQELGAALNERPTARARFDAASRAKLRKDRERLSAYASAMNQIRFPLEWTLHDAIGRASQLGPFPGHPVPSVDTANLEPSELADLRSLGDQLGRSWGPITRGDDFVWRDLRPRDGGPGEGRLRALVDRVSAALAEVRRQIDPITEELQVPRVAAADRTPQLLDLLELVENRSPVGVDWLTSSDLDATRTKMAGLQERVDLEVELRERLDGIASGWSAVDPAAKDQFEIQVARLQSAVPGIELDRAATVADIDGFARVLGEIDAILATLAEPLATLCHTFGFPHAPSIDDARRLQGLGGLVGGVNPPESSWLTPTASTAIQEARRVLQEHLTRYRERREALREVFTDEVLELDLNGLSVRFRDVHKGIGKLGGTYRADKRTIASAAVTGKASKDVVAQLDAALAWQQAATELASAEQRHAGFLGDRYYGPRDDVDFDEVERAIAMADQALELAAGEVDQAHLAAQLALGAQPDPGLPLSAGEVEAALARLAPHVQRPPRYLDWDAVSKLSIPALRSWIAEVSDALRQTSELLGGVEGLSEGPATVAWAAALFTDRALHARCSVSLTDDRQRLELILGDLAEDLTSEALVAARRWVDAVHEHFGGPIRETRASMILRTQLKAEPLRSADSDYEKARTALLSEFRDPQRDVVDRDLSGSFEDADELLSHLSTTVADASEWATYSDARNQLRELGWAPVVGQAEEERLAADLVGDAIEHAVLTRWIEQLMGGDGRLAPSRAQERDHLQEEFKQLDAALVRDAAARVINACTERRPKSLVGQAGVIQQQAMLKRRHMPVRKLLGQAHDAAQRLKPCFMMRPLSVSQFLPPELRFDVVIFDEASQVREADAICCVYRGSQLIVAGDPKQLPPTAFFQKMADGEEEDIDEELLDFESILDRCKAQGFPSLPLNWHYRSRHESLITFSNYSFYDGRLHTFPGATFESPDLGVELFKVDGEYRRGATRDNPIEAEAVVDRIVFHRRRHPELTIGVVALSVAQQTCIEAAIERRSFGEPELRDLVTDSRLDGFFVKNLENVQGDERDIIILSVGYGPDEVGKLTMNFGPMSRPGGERRSTSL
ncbi:DUF4011 domain-containing protein [Aquihabitans daechungensis]|uniref:DUF4011 domain-containing protein n=1 Tax=Aquihabitans daechungensis TaxID=1052257 RepID=UPI003BA15FE7